MGGNPTVCKGFYIYMGMFVNTRGKLQRHLNDKHRILLPRDLGLEINTLGQGCIVREIDWIISLRGMHCGKHEEKAHTGAGAPSHVLLPRITTRLPSPSSFYNKEAHSSSGGIK
jgi:hypothetical protein